MKGCSRLPGALCFHLYGFAGSHTCVDMQLSFVAVNDFGLAVALEIEDAGSGASAGIILCFAIGPKYLSAVRRAVVAVNDVIIASSDADIGDRITIKVGDNRGTRAGIALTGVAARTTVVDIL